MLFQNYIIIEGRLTQKPEVRTSNTGVEYCRFGICYNQLKKRDGKNEKGYEWDSVPHFFNCVCYRKTAESISNLQKGDPVTVSGKLQFSSYTKNDVKINAVNILANSVKKISLESKRDRTSVPTPEPMTNSSYPTPQDFAAEGIPFEESDIPF